MEQTKFNTVEDLEIVDFVETDSRYDNLEKYGDMENSCICCGKPIKNQKFWINTIEGPSPVHKDVTEEDMERFGYYPQGMFPIGPECKNKYPKSHIIINEE